MEKGWRATHALLAKVTSGCQGLGGRGEEWGVTEEGLRGSSWGDAMFWD